MNNDMMAIIKKTKQAYKRYLQTCDGTDYLFYTRVRNQAKKCCRTAVRNFEKKIARNPKQNPKAFFMYARSKLKTKEGVADLSDGANHLMRARQTFLTIFSSVFIDEDNYKHLIK